MSAFTLGPWRLDDAINAHVIAEDYHSIDAGHGFGPDGFGLTGCMSLADARLIAAAPDLLAACIEALPQAEGCFANHYGDNPEGGSLPRHIAMLRAAIEKATKP